MGLMLVAGCSAPEPMVTGPVHPAMWQVSDGDTRIILLGSVHLLPADLDWQDDRIRRAVEQSDQLLLELAPSEVEQAPALFALMASDEAVAPIDQRLDAVAADRLVDLAGAAGLDERDADRMESWALSLTVSNVSTADSGLAVDNGVEQRLTAAFARANKPVSGLETARQQLALFDDLPVPLQDQMLTQSVRRSNGAADTIRATVRAWASGDTAALARLAHQDFIQLPGLFGPLVTDRNRRWADQLSARMQRPGTVLVAVGAAHLVGPDNLPAMLSARGFVVERLPDR
ncbi:TraB/GumN family protein [Sphingomonas lacunae]|uniref:TraB/GumN family protein n=1 Tax=Sphingomonas lacunae TaxID=2698828 RepID=A0A6M4B0S6_9SPHN|nr:TraB/GumN family protein [Sphingomonas lacunae]QJQ32941.1 TraB/GumN family protein [Sphingomonas lacunae]